MLRREMCDLPNFSTLRFPRTCFGVARAVVAHRNRKPCKIWERILSYSLKVVELVDEDEDKDEARFRKDLWLFKYSMWHRMISFSVLFVPNYRDKVQRYLGNGPTATQEVNIMETRCSRNSIWPKISSDKWLAVMLYRNVVATMGHFGAYNHSSSATQRYNNSKK